MSKRVQFCGVIQGSVTLRPGETAEQAIERAEGDLCVLLASRARGWPNWSNEDPESQSAKEAK